MGLLDVPAVTLANLATAMGSAATTLGSPLQAGIDANYQRFTPRSGRVNLHYADKPVVSLRVDDSSTPDYTMATLMTARGLVGTFAIIWQRVLDGTGTTLDQYLEMQRNGHQLAVHARSATSHGVAPANFAAFLDEVYTARQEMMAAGLIVDHHIAPGPWGTDPNSPYYFDSLKKLDTPEGRYLRSIYQTSDSYLLDSMTGLTGDPRPIPAMSEYAAHHTTWETNTLSDITNQIEKLKARSQPSSMQVLTHGYTLDASTGSSVSTATYTAWLDYLATERDAGRLYVMTESAALLARPGARLNLFGDASFEKFTTNAAQSEWLGGTGSSSTTGETSGNAVALASGIGNGIYQYVRAVDGYRSMEVTARVKHISGTSPGTARLLVQYTGGAPDGTNAANVQKTLSLTAGSGWQTIRMPFGVLPGMSAAKVQLINNTSGAVIAFDDAALRVC